VIELKYLTDLFQIPNPIKRNSLNYHFTKVNMKQLIYFIIIFSTKILFGQTNYSGLIGKYPIELCADINTSGNSDGVYAYSAFDNPIILEGNLEKEKLILFEKDSKGKKAQF
jgi:hypothetical protein